MKNSKNINLGDFVYHTTKYSATSGTKLLLKLARLLSKAASGMLGSGMIKEGDELNALADIKGVLDKKLDPASIGAGIEKIFDMLDEETGMALIMRILDTTSVIINDKKMPLKSEYFDLHFTGKYLELFKLLKDVLLFQYEDFLVGNP